MLTNVEVVVGGREMETGELNLLTSLLRKVNAGGTWSACLETLI